MTPLPRLVWVCVTLTAAPLPLSGQWRSGVVVGLNSAHIGGSYVEGTSVTSVHGFMFGAFLERTAGNILSIRPELLFEQKGGAEWEGPRSLTLRLNYVELALLLKARISLQSGLKPYFLFGPALGRRVSCKAEESQGLTTTRAVEGSEAGRAFKKMDFGLVFAGGFAMGVGPGELSLGIRANAGTMNINDTESEGGDGEKNNGVLSFVVGMSFPVGARSAGVS